MIILVDMDGPLADFEGEFLRRWREYHPDKKYIPYEDRKVFGVDNEYPQEYVPLIRRIIESESFFRSLPPTEGGLEAIKKLSEFHDVFICTSPLKKYEHCVEGKYSWVDEYLGFDWTKRIVLTKDKTLVRGDYLIDDKPEIKGILSPEWEHLVFDAPYNRGSTRRRIDWDNYQDLFP